MNDCPKCRGTLTAPYWFRSQQGKCLAISCLNCGWVLFHPTKVVYYVGTEPENLPTKEEEAAW